MTTSIKIPLYASFGNKRAHRKKFLLATLLSVIFFSAFFYLYLLVINDAQLNYSMIPFYFIVPIFMIWDAKRTNSYFIQVGEENIVFRNSKWLGNTQLTRSEISYININPHEIIIATNDLRKFNIELSYAKHSDVQKIKQQLTDFRRSALK